MALTLKDRVLETCSAPGTGAVTLLGAVTGYQTFSSAIGNANTCYYTIADQNGANWEVGIGTYATSGNTLTRTTVLSSSNAGSTVNFATGTQNVFVTYPSERSVNLSSSALTSGRVTYATTDGLLTDSANMTFDGTTLTTTNVSILGNASTNPFVVNTNANGSLPSASLNGLIISQNYTAGAAEVDFFYNQSSYVGDNGGFRFYQRTGTSTANEMMRMTQNSVITYTGGTERMRVDSSGNVGIGTSSVNNSSAGRTVLELNNSSNTLLNMSVAGTRQGGIYSDTSSVIFGSFANIPALFSTNNTERMRIDTSGNFMVGTTGGASANNTNSFAAIPASGGGYIIVQHASGSASGFPYAYFVYNTSVIGSITQTGTTAVLYNTTSDYRLKTDATPIQNALATVEALNPVNFTWVDGRKDDGFLAHEIQAVIPNCVTGEKDAVETVDDVDADGKVIGTKEVPKYQQMDNSGVIPFLVKAIQELNAKVTALEAQLAVK